MAFSVTDVLEGYSKAIYSTWFYYAPDRVLFDAGEGLASRLENRAFAIRRVFLSHGHLDHISGLPTLVHIRSAGMGEKTKPLDIYYPEGDSFVQGLKTHLDRAMGRRTFDLNWHALPADAHVSLTADEDDEGAPRQHERWLETFATRHSRGRLTLGYRVMEQRTRLRPEFVGRPEPEIRAMVQSQGREAVTERYAHRLLAYLGDGVPIETGPFAGSDILMHEATFIDPADREQHVHSTLEEAVETAIQAQARHLVLYHISSRYPRKLMRRRVMETLESGGFPMDRAWLVFERYWDRADTLARWTERKSGNGDSLDEA